MIPTIHMPDMRRSSLKLLAVSVLVATVLACSFETSIADPTDGSFSVMIDVNEMATPGHFVDLDIMLTEQTLEIGGFDLLLSYDPGAVTLMSAVADQTTLYGTCGWEYFTFRFNPYDTSYGDLPDGLVRVAGLADLNDGDNHPTCFQVDDNKTLFTLKFFLSKGENLGCSYVPVNFYWVECTDNVLTTMSGDRLFISSSVQNPDFRVYPNTYGPDLSEMYPDRVFPTVAGAPDECAVSQKVPPEREIDFFNGGIDVGCRCSDVGSPGDINLDGYPFTVADAVLYSQYFADGLIAFWRVLGDLPVEGAVAASDCNLDGLSLSVADFAFLVRIMQMDFAFDPKIPWKTNPVPMKIHNDGGVLSVSGTLGAAFVELDGHADPVLLAEGVDMLCGSDGRNTRVLIYSLDNRPFGGEFLAVDAEVVSVELATTEGAPVIASLTPRQFVLEQNYPNPFNPTTTIQFSMPASGEYTVTIFNTEGRQVSTLNGTAEAGTVSLLWDAEGLASGVYFYRLNTAGIEETKKMILLR